MERLRCVPRILRVANARAGGPLDAHEVEDLVQDTLAAVWRKLPTFSGDSSLETWVYGFCLHELMNAIRRHRTQTARTGHRLDASTPEPFEAPRELASSFERERLYAAVDRLEADEARVLRLKHFAEMTFAEIGERLGLSPNTIKTRYYRALERLRRILGAGGQEDER